MEELDLRDEKKHGEDIVAASPLLEPPSGTCSYPAITTHSSPIIDNSTNMSMSPTKKSPFKVKRANGFMTGENSGPYSNENSKHSESVTKKDLSVPSPTVPPDGGWGWVVLAASFVCNAIVEGLITCFGVLMPEIASYFGASTAKTALAGSVLIGAFLMSGPVVSWFLNRFGGRKSAIFGGILAAGSFLFSTLSPNINILILLYGLFGGIGVGFFYMPGMVMVGYYFEKRRAMAMGVASAGAGVGMLVFAPLAAYLVDVYDWKNTVVILAGCTLQVVICGALFRPLQPVRVPREVESLHKSDDGEHANKPTNGYLPSERKINSPLDRFKRCKMFNNTEISRSNHELGNIPLVEVKLPLKPESGPRTPVISMESSQLSHDNLNGHLKENGNNGLNSRHYKPSGWQSCHEINGRKGDNHLHHRHPHHHHSNAHLGHSQLSWSIPELQAMSVDHIAHNHTSACTENTDESSEDNRVVNARCKRWISCICDVDLCLHPACVVLCCGALLIQIAYFVPIVFIAKYAATIGVGAQQASFLISIMGICNMFGRMLAGVLADLPQVNKLHLCNISLIIAGISTILCTWASTYTYLVIYSIVFGYFSAAFVPLTSLFIVQYLGLEKLTDAFGILSLVRGVGSMAGPPIAGAILDATSMPPVFYFAGGFLILSGFVHYLLPFVAKYETEPEDGDTESDDKEV